jgi:adenine-specific DNA-methyltransferase
MGYRYIGAKTQIVESVITHISKIVGKTGRIADIMCGTGAVSAALRLRGYQVIANDVMTYSYHHARVLLGFTRLPRFSRTKDFIKEFTPNSAPESLFPPSQYEQVLRALNNVPEERGYFLREFSSAGSPKNGEQPRNYFAPHNAAKIDAIRGWIRRLKEEKLITEIEHSLLTHDLVMAANDVANIAGTYGHYLSKMVERAKVPIVLTPTQLILRNDAGSHKVYQARAEDLASRLSCDLCYVDPPYMKRQYAANYHVLETLGRGDEPEAIGVSGLRPWRDQYSNFCTKTKIRDSFRKMINDMECSDFLVSYSEDGLLSIEDLKKLFNEFGEVKMQAVANKRFKSNNSKLAPVLTEYLFHLQKA